MPRPKSTRPLVRSTDTYDKGKTFKSTQYEIGFQNDVFKDAAQAQIDADKKRLSRARSERTKNSLNKNIKRFEKTKQIVASNVRQLSKDMSSTGQTMDKGTRKQMQNFYYRQQRKANGLAAG